MAASVRRGACPSHRAPGRSHEKGKGRRLSMASAGKSAGRAPGATGLTSCRQTATERLDVARSRATVISPGARRLPSTNIAESRSEQRWNRIGVRS